MVEKITNSKIADALRDLIKLCKNGCGISESSKRFIETADREIYHKEHNSGVNRRAAVAATRSRKRS